MNFNNVLCSRVLIPLLLSALSSQSIATDITDIPLAVKNSVKPNITFVLDNSGSMDWFSITGTDALAQYSNTLIDYYSHQVNQIYYNPNVVYTPGVAYNSFSSTTPDGLPMANAGTGTNTASGGNAAINDPYLPLLSTGSSSPRHPTVNGSPTWSRTNLNTTCYYSGATPPVNSATSTTNCKAFGGAYVNGPIARYAYYYEFVGVGTPSPGSHPATDYVRRDIISTTATYTRAASRTDCSVSGATATCTFAQELQNFANWWTYYRSRILTMKTAMGQAFSTMTDKYRVGFSTINAFNTTGNTTGDFFWSVADFNSATKTNWFKQLYAINPSGGTPLQNALSRVGEYYKGSTMGYSTGSVGDDDPVQFSCQSNYAILSTDGFWNSNTVTLGNHDQTVPTVPSSALVPAPVTGLTSGATWPRPIYEGATTSSNSLADVAAYYWITDLRTTGATATNNVPANSSDPASWQHMTTFTIGLGADGSKDYREDYLTASSGFYKDVVDGNDNWPVPAQNTNTAIDDLWHAAVNGHGQYFSAKSPTALRTALRKVLDEIVARDGAAAAVAVANANVTSGDNALYASSYNSGTWTGDLDSFAIDLVTGVPSSTSSWSGGSAQTQLDLRTSAVSDRFIVTYSGTGYSSSGIQFQSNAATIGGSIATKLSATQDARFNTPSATDSAAVIAYLRGDRSGETAGTYRTRAHILGDIINAEPVVVRAPSRRYIDDGYAAFKLANASRTKMVAQASNDGMLHFFNATTGAENWAYVPNLLIETSDPNNSGASVLNMLTRKVFTHRMNIDATPFVGDVDFNKTDGASGSPNWKTILVGGLGHGGRGIYALDVTTPNVGSETEASNRVLWEFPNATTNATVKANIGYIFGRPIIVKTKAKGWVVLVAAGYNNGTGADNSGGDGHGYLFVLNARTGELIKAIDTTQGSTTNPAGLAHISAFVEDSEYNNTVYHVYGGDLLGNVWRFDLSDASDYNNWTVKRLAILKDGSSGSANTQPVTTEPQFAVIRTSSGFKRLVYVGTGRYLGDADVPTVATETVPGSQTQTMYALVDDLTNPTGVTPVISDNLRTYLTQKTFVDAGTTRSVSGSSPSYVAPGNKGWFIDLYDNYGGPVGTGPSERVNTHPALVSGALVFTTNIPNTDPCIPGGSSWINILDYKTGGALLDSSGNPLAASTSLGNSLASRPVIINLKGVGVKALTRSSTGQTVTSSTGITPTNPAGKRAAWREIPK